MSGGDNSYEEDRKTVRERLGERCFRGVRKTLPLLKPFLPAGRSDLMCGIGENGIKQSK